MKTICCSAPGRAGIIGNPTDMYGGTVISCSIAYRAHVTVEPCDQLQAEGAGQQMIFEGPDDLVLNGDYFDVTRAILDYLRDDSLCCKISYRTDIPIKAGVADSYSEPR